MTPTKPPNTRQAVGVVFPSGLGILCFLRQFLMNWQASAALNRKLVRVLQTSLLLIFTLVVNAGTAWATCGDYLHGHRHIAGQMDRHTPFVANLSKLGQSRPLEQTPGPVCSGPNCQSGNRSPLLPTRVIEIPSHSDAILASTTVLLRGDVRSSSQLDQVAAVDGPADRLFRPPRSV